MSRTLKRPMFRRGGTVNDGIMTGLTDRKQYANISDANAVKATTVTRVIGGKTMTYQPKWFADSTVVTE